MKKTQDFQEYLYRLEDAGLLEYEIISGDTTGTEVRDITYDSREAGPDTLFVCKGANFKEGYLSDAIKAGASCYVSEREYRADIPAAIVTDIRKAMPVIADVFYGESWRDIKLTGITGTKGKSTTAFFLKYILDENAARKGKPETAIMSGIETYDGVGRSESRLTTPEAMELRRHIDNAAGQGIENMVMEVSSQALKYGRTEGIVYDAACFLNLGEDHISPLEHPSLEDYAASKMKLFDQCRSCAVNADSDLAGQVIMRAAASELNERVITFGTESGNGPDVYGYDIRSSRDGISFRVRTADLDEEFSIGMMGIFNVSNALAAISLAILLDIPVSDIKKGLAKARVKGRMELFTDKEGKVTAIVDYAHNRMSLKALIDSVRQEFPGSSISVVFGSTGDKAVSRRKGLGEVAGRYADMCYLTEDDPGTESPHAIAEEIAGYIEAEGGRYEIIDDRAEAVETAVKNAPEGGVVLVTAKGRDTTQKRGLEYVKVPSDVELVKAALARL